MRNKFRQLIITLLKSEARLVLRRFKPIIIAITGSVGKTSTKEAIWILLSQHYPTRKSPKSYNSEFGVPLAILGLESAWNSPTGWIVNLLRGLLRIFSRKPYPQYLILEMGIDRPGDLQQMMGWIQPHISVITAVGDIPVHVEYFSDPHAVAEEKSRLIQTLTKNDFAVLNGDDPRVYSMRKKTPANIILYGFGRDAMVRGSDYRLTTKNRLPSGFSLKIKLEEKNIQVKTAMVLGKQNAYVLLAAASVGQALGLNPIEIEEGLSKYKPLPGRMHCIEGIRKSLLIDDSYNASPIATEAALEVLASIPASRKIAVLGDMLELGKFTPEEHRKVGILAARIADVVIAIGLRAKFMESGSTKAFHWFKDSESVVDFLRQYIGAGDIVLVKGSQGMRMEKITEALMANPERAKDLLVRQEPYWQTHA